MKATYQNRMGDDIQFELISENEIQMSGFIYFRSGQKEDGSIEFVDPSGGPYISVGTDMNRYFNGKLKKEVKIKSIENIDGKTILKV